MRFDIDTRQTLRARLAEMSARMAAWDQQPPPLPDQHQRLIEAIEPFEHTTHATALIIGGVDGSGDFPAAAYADSFVYASVASAALYESDPVHGLREVGRDLRPVVEFTWLTTSEQQRAASLLESFERLVGRSIDEVLAGSDYRDLGSGGQRNGAAYRGALIVPPPHDAGNIGIQLRTTAELAAALQLIESVPDGALILTEGTMSLPFVQHGKQSLFFEHLRRFCCVRARARGVYFAALSKSHGLPSGIRLEEAAREKSGVAEPEHWFLRIPDTTRDGWSLWPPDGPRVPPVGAVSFFVRLHKSMPIMRLDMDVRFWEERMGGAADVEATRRFFGALDYSSHDQRCYGFPYPIKAARDRSTLTDQERAALRQQLVEAGVRAGMRRSSFRDPAPLTRRA